MNRERHAVGRGKCAREDGERCSEGGEHVIEQGEHTIGQVEHAIEYGDHVVAFTLIRRPRRTLEIAVEPDARVVVVAPLEAALTEIEEKVRLRAGWIRRQQRFFEQFQPRTPERRYLAGETHWYLGRQYRLRVEVGTPGGVKMVRGFIVVSQSAPIDPDVTRKLVQEWFLARARVKFAERLDVNLRRFPDPEAYRPRGLIIRRIQLRWGSMSPGRRLVLNRRLIEAPVDAIDYVITHELCHVAEPHHGPAFIALLDRVLPDWRRRKERLERAMA